MEARYANGTLIVERGTYLLAWARLKAEIGTLKVHCHDIQGPHDKSHNRNRRVCAWFTFFEQLAQQILCSRRAIGDMHDVQNCCDI